MRQSLARHFIVTSQNDAAEATLHESLELARAAGDKRQEAMATGALGILFQFLGRYAEAQEHAERHGALSREIGDRGGEAAASGNLGNILLLLGRHSDAREHHDRHRALSREIGDRLGEAIATGNLGSDFVCLGRYAEAREHFDRHRALCRETGNRSGEVIATFNLGALLRELGRTAEAQEHYERARDITIEIGSRRTEGYVLGGLASLAEMRGDAAAAVRLYSEALAQMRELADKFGVSNMLTALGRVEAAPAHLDEALELARETKSPETILAVTVERARLPDGDVGTALAAFAEYADGAGHAGRMDACFRLWELTQDRTHLDEAHRLLCFMRDHAPEEDRDSMIENVPLHRDIMKAWEEHGETG